MGSVGELSVSSCITGKLTTKGGKRGQMSIIGLLSKLDGIDPIVVAINLKSIDQKS